MWLRYSPVLMSRRLLLQLSAIYHAPYPLFPRRAWERVVMVRILKLGCTRRLTENSLPYRQLLLRCSNSCIHAVVRCQQIGLKIRFYSLNSSLFASQNRIFILNFLSSSLRALFSVSLLVPHLPVFDMFRQMGY